jgi:glyoxylase I family protein
MEKVLGFGGFFFRARDPQLLAKWYEDHLGITRTAPDYEHAYWVQERGPTVFEPFKQDTTYFGGSQYSFMLNFRVTNLPAMVQQLRTAGISVEVDEQVYPNGVFARLQDPEGNPIAIWQPKGNELALPPTPREANAA